MKFWIKDINGNILYKYAEGGDTSDCEVCLNAYKQGVCKHGRYANTKTSNDLSYIFCHNKNTIGKQAKYISNIVVDAHAKALTHNNHVISLIKNYESIALHNAKKITSDIGLKINRLISEEELSRSQDKISLIDVRLRNNSKEAAREIWSVIKSLNQLDYEYNSLESYSQLADQNRSSLVQEFTKHKAHTLLLMSYYLHEEDFQSKNLKLEITPFTGFVYVDFAIARSAISQILSNAIKYCRPNSKAMANIYCKGDYTYFNFKMCSRFFTNAEKSKFTIEKYRGINSSGTKGQGLGLFSACQMMRLNLGGIEISSDEKVVYGSDGIQYSNNEFTLYFKTE